MVRIYELVSGAEIVGRATPGVLVTGSIELQPPGQQPLEMQYEARADAGGEYRLRVPYSTDRNGGVGNGSRLRLEADGRRAELEIPEAAARNSLVLAAPALR